uniref:Uncharacterized protein n=1 Tax=Mycena chlorophos TaxID=658473 RepID=A0ABQ0MB44_MYCCL|nr:predicted protein [Mycena chlorophos]
MTQLDHIPDIQTLHLLLTEPTPHAKSLHGLIAGARTPVEKSAFHTSVENAVYGAFWDEARQRLQADPPAQLERLKGLFGDIREAFLPLFRRGDPILAELIMMPPTTDPLASAKLVLRDVLLGARRRAAPIRDPLIDGLLDDLERPSSAETVVHVVKNILALADLMKSDLSDLALASMSEAELRLHLTQQTQHRERTAILDIWGGKAHVDELWDAWVAAADNQKSSRGAWIQRLLRSLSATIPISCPIPEAIVPEAETNILPPPFLFSQPQLLRAQNYLQALVVAASLRSLVSIADGTHPDFIPRIWALLETEIVHNTAFEEQGTKLINLADEVIRVRGAVDTAEEARLRAAVDRTLRSRARPTNNESAAAAASSSSRY